MGIIWWHHDYINIYFHVQEDPILLDSMSVCMSKRIAQLRLLKELPELYQCVVCGIIIYFNVINLYPYDCPLNGLLCSFIPLIHRAFH